MMSLVCVGVWFASLGVLIKISLRNHWRHSLIVVLGFPQPPSDPPGYEGDLLAYGPPGPDVWRG